ncbi:peptide deformylase [Aliidiomarina quisquiliarum]|uniref:peptide deformylase n=1 Tax=Aliidiomarina quisquiliarum TaxID=2938947 RepID=UPI00208EB2E1|nr:peptide deformylase [Aliidiomarina quisquiliarum]MCO4321300.1 peptide deformylase [Aliidiomarina quisquiliarum]
MAIMHVLRYPDQRLRTQAVPVVTVDDNLRTVIDNMFETMYHSQGVGLAATQVDIHQRLFIADCGTEQKEPLVFINPEIIEQEGLFENEEGCLSFPGVYASVERAGTVKVKALDRNGELFEMEADGLLAICIQHEIDHLNGKLFVDYLSPLKRDRIRKKLEKEARFAEREA